MSRQVSWNRQLGLAVALFILGTGAYWLEYKHKPSRESAEEQSKRIFQIKDDPVQAIHLQEGAKKVSLVCTDFSAKLCKPGDNSKWEIADPMKLRADDSNVNSLLSTLNTLTANETIGLKEETPEKKAALLKEYGLDPESRKSSRKVRIKTGSQETVLYLGGTHPIGDGVFAVRGTVQGAAKGTNPAATQEAEGPVEDDHVYLIPSYFKANLEKDLTHWRDKKLLSLGVHEIESFKYQSNTPASVKAQAQAGEGQFSAERKESQWVLKTAKEELPGDLENIDSFLGASTSLSAKGFASDQKSNAKAKATLQGYQPSITLTLQREKGTAQEAPAPITLTLFQKRPAQKEARVYATVSHLDPLFELEPSVAERLTKTVKDLRLVKLLSSMDRFSAKRMEFSGSPIGTTPLLLTQEKGKWVSAPDSTSSSSGPTSGLISHDKVQQTLERLSGNKIKDFLTGAAIPKGEKEGLKLSIGDEKGTPLKQLVFWKQNAKLYARDLQSKRNEAFLIESGAQDALPWDRSFFRIPETKGESKADTPKK